MAWHEVIKYWAHPCTPTEAQGPSGSDFICPLCIRSHCLRHSYHIRLSNYIHHRVGKFLGVGSLGDHPYRSHALLVSGLFDYRLSRKRRCWRVCSVDIAMRSAVVQTSLGLRRITRPRSTSGRTRLATCRVQHRASRLRPSSGDATDAASRPITALSTSSPPEKPAICRWASKQAFHLHSNEHHSTTFRY